MKKKRTLQNNLSYALKYMFGNYGINIFLDSKKFIVTLDNLIPNLQEETNASCKRSFGIFGIQL